MARDKVINVFGKIVSAVSLDIAYKEGYITSTEYRDTLVYNAAKTASNNVVPKLIYVNGVYKGVLYNGESLFPSACKRLKII